MRFAKRLGIVLLVSCLAACGGGSRERVPADAPGYMKGKPVHPTIKIGVPYKVKGERYYPEYDPDYDDEGLASWYGPNFHGKSTANGERYNQWAMTAAHKTLPMPSMVRVTHRKTGKSIIVRVNDRGPFADGRIIDLSRAAAEELGTIREGVAPVRVEYLKAETEHYIAKLQLKKPKKWSEKDIQLAKVEEKEEETRDIFMVRFDPKVKGAAPAVRKPVNRPHPVESASVVPEHFAFNLPTPQRSTLDVRGVKMENIGYAEDAFSVLDRSDGYASDASHRAPLPASLPFGVVSAPSRTQALPARQGGEQWFVQVGSFILKDNAQTLANRLSSMAAVDVRKVDEGDFLFYRVRLGPTRYKQTAQQWLNQLQESGISHAVMVVE